MKPACLAFACVLVLSPDGVRGDGASDNIPENVRRIPPPGVAIPDDARQELTVGAARLKENLDGAAAGWEPFPERSSYLPDVQVFWKAVDWALRYDEFYDAKQVEWARAQLKEAFARLEALAKGQTPWLAQTGLVVRGYTSKIDGSVQPFGLVVPPSFNPNHPHRWRLDCWFHGRGEKLTELDFIHGRQTSPGEFTPQDTIVLHPYGRYCNGQRFAGETDFFEALDTVKRDYRIDDDRIVVRGFSLGGAACWHLAAHHAWQWCAAAPGAGFSETEEFLNFFQGEKLQPQPWERTLWNLYDSTAVAANFFNLPTVAYSGEIDKQKQAADAMAKALEKEGMTLTHIIGPKTAHKYEPGAKAEVSRRIDQLAAKTKQDRFVDADTCETYTLRYNRTQFAVIDGLTEHWKKAKLVFLGAGAQSHSVHVTNVASFSLRLPPGYGPSLPGFKFIRQLMPDVPDILSVKIRVIDTEDPQSNVEFPIGNPTSDGSLEASFHKENGKWVTGPLPPDGLRKKHGLQGPIDDAFMDSFLFVRPTGAAANEKAGAWSKAELDRAIEHWRRHFRGDARVKDDSQVTAHDMQTANLVLWGDASSNKLISRLLAGGESVAGQDPSALRVPISWSMTEIKAGDRTFPAVNHALIAIYPNPLNPEKYVVLNSSFTFRDYDYLNNARQTPKLPDWAIIDLDTPPNSRAPGKVVAADFFGERWEIKPTN